MQQSGNHPMHENYGGIKQGNFTVADTNYAGTVTIGGQKANGSGTATAAVDTSGFGLGSGSHISGS